MKKGFTLAEVLITLGIIGIVAAITLPVLIQSHKKQVAETKLKKFYSMINQAIKMSENDNGDKESWTWRYNSNEFGTEYSYNTYLKNYIEVIDTQKVSSNEMRIFLKDGTAIILEGQGSNGGYVSLCLHSSDCKYSEKNQANSMTKLYKLYAKQIFAFGFFPSVSNNSNYRYHYKKGVEPYRVFLDYSAYKNNPYTFGSNAHLNCNPNTTGMKLYCTAIIQENEWKFPKDYPFKL